MKTKSFAYNGAVAIVFLCMFFEAGSNMLLSATKEPLMAYFGVGTSEISILFTIRSIFCAIIPVFCGRLSDKFGRKSMIFTGCLFYLVFYAFVPQLDVFFPMFILVALAGVGYSFMDPSAQSVLFDRFDNPTPYMPFIQLSFSGGSIIAPLLVSFLLERNMPWQTAYYIYLIFGIALAVFVATRKFPQSARSRAESSGEPDESHNRFAHEPRVLNEGLAVFLLVVFSNIAIASVSNWADVYMTNVFGSSAEASVRILSYYQAGGMLGALVTSIAARKMSTTKLLAAWPLISFLLFALAIAVPSSTAFTMLLSATAMFAGSLFSMSVGYVGQLFWRKSGAATGIISSGSAVGMTLSSILAGQLIPTIGVRMFYIIMVSAMLLAAAMGIYIHIHHKRYLLRTS